MKTLVIGLTALTTLLAVMALYSAYGTWRTEREFGPIGRFVEVDGNRLHYVDEGTGSPIVLIHGASSSLRDFVASILPPLADRHRVIAFDRPGFGYSERPDGSWPTPADQARLIERALGALGVERPVLVGHSWSGSVVLAYMLEKADRVAGGVLLAGASHPWTSGVDWQNHIAGIPVLGPLFARTLVFPAGQLLLEHAVAGIFAPNPVTPRYVERTGAALALRPGTFLANAEDLRRLSPYLEVQSRRYEQIDTPLLLITGDADDVVPPWNHAERLIRQAPRAKLVYLEGIGHAPHHSDPKGVSALIEEFVRDI